MKSWPADAVMIVSANRGEEVRENMEAVAQAVCRDCGQELAADTRTIRTAMESPLRNGRPVLFFCVPCAVTYDFGTISHFADHRHHPGAPITPGCPRRN
jgi:hypothetical protein